MRQLLELILAPRRPAKQRADQPGADTASQPKPLRTSGLLSAIYHLEAVEQMLADPTPEKIRAAAVLIEEAQRLVQQFVRRHKSVEPDDVETLQKLERFHQSSARVSRLLQGALRFQWAKMRQIGLLTQSYTRGGKLRHWQPATQVRLDG